MIYFLEELYFHLLTKNMGDILSLTQTMAGNLTDNIIKTNKDKTYVNIEKIFSNSRNNS